MPVISADEVMKVNRSSTFIEIVGDACLADLIMTGLLTIELLPISASTHGLLE
jgi:hypothetical protein